MPSSRERSRLTQRPAPPDYTQRSVKLKLFVMLAALFVILALAERAGDRKSWEWMWQLGDKRVRDEPFNNRIEPEPLLTENDPAGTFIAVSDDPASRKPAAEELNAGSGGATPGHSRSEAKRGSGAETAPEPGFDPVARAWEQGWRDVFERLESDERSLLFEMLHAARYHQTLPAERTSAAAELLAKAQALWDDYQTLAFQSVAELQGDDQTRWVDVLRQVNERFTSDLRPALQALIDTRAPTESEQQALLALETTLRELTLDRIEDDTVFRPAEREIWFHELGRVRDTDPIELENQSAGYVAYLQLFKQPDEYRGQVVTVEGTAKLAYRVQAPSNYLGITQYYVFWIHPRGGPDAPIVAYALDVPPGFPPISDKDLDRATTTLHEELSVTGVFFKRWAYAGKDGTYTAPLLVTHTPNWQPTQSPLHAAHQALGPRDYAAIVGAALVLALIAAGVLWRLTRRERTTDEAYGPAGTSLARLGDVPLALSPEEALKSLEREARGGS